MTNMNPDYIKYETGYCNCRDMLVNNLVYKYVPLGSIIATEQGVIRDFGASEDGFDVAGAVFQSVWHCTCACLTFFRPGQSLSGKIQNWYLGLFLAPLQCSGAATS